MKKERTSKRNQKMEAMMQPQEMDYRVYHCTVPEALLGFLLGMAAGFVVVYLMFRSVRPAMVLAVPAGIFGIRAMRGSLKERRDHRLLMEFRDMMDGLEGAFSAGESYRKAMETCRTQLERSYGDDSLLAKELERVLRKMEMGKELDKLLVDLAERTGLEDFRSFADVFRVTINRGGDMRKAVNFSRTPIIEKIDAENSICAGIADARQELKIMMVLPLVVTLMMMGTTGGETGSTGAMLLLRCVALALYVSAGLLGRRLLRIRI